MKRILIAIGCNKYEFLAPLGSAESDARNIFDQLTGGNFGTYDTKDSVLLLSPTLHELQQSLSGVNCQISDTLTVFFAGHGHVKAGSFHMCLRDTHEERLSTTAYPLNNLLTFVQELSPRQANIIVDACESGGVVGDISRALNPDVIGIAGSTGISLLAACAKDQFAYESLDGGRCTSTIVRCLSGEVFLQDITEELDLIEVAKQVADAFGNNKQQTPTYWGLNLTGYPNFCRNPHFSSDSPLRRTLAATPTLSLPRDLQRRLWSIYQDSQANWDSGRLRDVLEEAIKYISEPEVAAHFARQIFVSFGSTLDQDAFQRLEMRATCLGSLLKLATASPHVQVFVESECKAIASEAFVLLDVIARELEEGRFFLVGSTGLGELFFLPIRILKLLGWLGFSLIALDALNPGQLDTAKRITRALLDDYPLSISAMSDEQAAHLVSAVAGLTKHGLIDECADLLGLLFHSAFANGDHIATPSIPADKIVEFLEARHSKTTASRKLLAHPSQLIFAMLLAADRLGLHDEIDAGMLDLDHVVINAFVPDTYSDYALERIEDGFNATFNIGHGVWTVEDVANTWDKTKRPSPESDEIALLSTLCSLIFSDRVAWHLLDRSKH
jgi:hypothetical protein